MLVTGAVSTKKPMRVPILPERGRLSWFELVLLLVCIGLVVASIPSSLRDVILLSFLFGGLALAWNIAGGYAGLISFGHAAFFGVGGYSTACLRRSFAAQARTHYGKPDYRSFHHLACCAAKDSFSQRSR
jgi:branched-chain amino acid transport system permease protein